MKKTLTAILLVTAFYSLGASSTVHAGQEPVTLLGADISIVDRNTFRQFARSRGLVAQQEGDHYWADVYNATNVGNGIQRLTVGYTYDNSGLAYARYIAPSRMNTEQVHQLTNVMRQLYGAPNKTSGSGRVGSYMAFWNLSTEIELRVYRNWPDTTTFIEYRNRSNYALMEQEIAAQRQQQDAERASAAAEFL